jgi:hypothetical protein
MVATAPRLQVRSEPPNAHRVSSQASAKPTKWQVRASHLHPPTGAQRQAMGPRLYPRVHRQSRANKLLPAGGNSGLPMEG